MKGITAYFSAEFGIDESLPIYSGGLGILAGDYIKAAGDMDIPVVGVGILYRKGYFEQKIRWDGSQEALYPSINPLECPIQAVKDHQENDLLIQVPIDGRTVFLKVWRVPVKSTVIYLMDAEVERNNPADRRLTDSLYGGTLETRLSQEIILGIGGVRLIRALGIEPEVWHMNEGHVALLTLERIREYLSQGMEFTTALEVVRSNTLFTTHTPVPAGHDVFNRYLVQRFLGCFCTPPGLQFDRLFELGKVKDQFNLTRYAYHTSSIINGVSKLHGLVSAGLLHEWTPDTPAQDVPVQAVTNGVHTQSWLSTELKELYARHLGDWESQITNCNLWAKVADIPDQDIWQAHLRAKETMIKALGLPIPKEALIIGFARRFATYKRALLVFKDLNRFSQIITDANKPVYLIFAGKAHPADMAGQELIRRIVEISRQGNLQNRIIFVENYNIAIAKLMVQGVDLWLNTPVKPLEASGTSGQKAGINGVLNCSIRDGWWDEGFNGDNGWAIDPASIDTEDRDLLDSQCLYRLLEQEIVPLYYAKNTEGYSAKWVGKMKQAIISLTPNYSTARMLTEYLDYFYRPLAERGKYFRTNDYQTAQRVAHYKDFIRKHWPRVQVQAIELYPQGQILVVKAKIWLGEIWKNDVKVEAVGSDGCGGIWKQQLNFSASPGQGSYIYEVTFPGTLDMWTQANPNIRVYPISPDFANDFELELSRWGQSPWR